MTEEETVASEVKQRVEWQRRGEQGRAVGAPGARVVARLEGNGGPC